MNAEDEIAALIFGPGLHRSGTRGVLSLRADGMEVRVNSQVQRVALSRLRLREVGFGKPGLELAWTEMHATSEEPNEEQWVVHVLDARLAAQLLSSAPLNSLPQVQALRARQRQQRVSRSVAWSLLSLLVLAPLLLLLLLFMQADRLAGWVTQRIPIAEEVKLGRSAFDSMKAQLQLQDSGAAYEAVQTLGRRLTQGSAYQYEFHVVADDTLNAFALPGGIVVVHTGLINATQRAEELAGVLAHEVQHVEQRHSLKGLVKNLGLRAVWALATGDIGGSLAGQAALQMTALKFSRDAETEADQRGFDALVVHDIDPAGMAQFFHTLSEQAADAPAAFLSSHPLSKQREAQLRQRLENLHQRAFVPLAMQPWPPR